MNPLRAVITLLLIAAPGTASAGYPPSRAPLPVPEAVRLPAGFHAVSCGVDGHGATRAEAMKRCEEGVKLSRWINKKRCACKRSADVIEIGRDVEPAFWLAGWTYRGATPAQAWARCMTAHEDRSYRPSAEDCDLKSLYGPFTRSHEHGEFDDKTRYRWLGSDGGWYDETGEGPCFTGETLVATPDGPRPIAAVAVGDAVVSWSLDAAAGEVSGRVVRKKERAVAEVLALTFTDGRVLRATPNHPLYSVSRGFVPAGDLRVGEAVATRGDGGLVPVALAAVSHEPGPVIVYDLTVSPSHTLFAAGVWAHNY